MDVQTIDIKWYKDWKFWLLVIAINISGNPGFNIIFPYYTTIIGLFIGLIAYTLFKQKKIDKVVYTYILLWICLFLFNAFYAKDFALNSTLHIIMKMTIGLLVLLVLNKKFLVYYSDIIYFFCILSLVCFIYNHIWGILPYISLGESMDGGNGFRVTSIIYTQLYNLNSHGLVFRNCGPFWEPGAFQGFINLAITTELLSDKVRDRKWNLKMFICVITVITTYSTGGYIVLALNIIYYLFTNKNLAELDKIILLGLFLMVALIVFIETDFLYSKIVNDRGRLGISFSDLFSDSILFTLFGYGFAGESIMQSDIKSASSVLNLFRYAGLIGILLYYIPLIGVQISLKRLFYTIVIFLIMMNEPFITAGVFWWSIPLLFPYISKIS